MLRRLLIVLGVTAVSAGATPAAPAAASRGGDGFEIEGRRDIAVCALNVAGELMRAAAGRLARP